MMLLLQTNLIYHIHLVKQHNGRGKAELLGAMLHTGNKSNLRKLLLGRGWAN